MTQISMLSTACAVLSALAIVAAAGTASAQTATSTTSSSAGVLSTSSTTTVKKKPTAATADMINEAIQRSEARAAKEAASGTPQQWGSEEPFTYDPTVKRFDKSMQ